MAVVRVSTEWEERFHHAWIAIIFRLYRLKSLEGEGEMLNRRRVR